MSWYWHGDEYRWRLRSGQSAPTIVVIDAAEEREAPANAHRVPFGFGIREKLEPVEPLRWEGDDS